MSMIPTEQRAGLGVHFFGDNKAMTATFYVEHGSSYVPLHQIPTNTGRIENHGDSQPIMGTSGLEIVWRTEFAPPAKLGELLRGYVAANGWKGSPEALKRIQTLG